MDTGGAEPNGCAWWSRFWPIAREQGRAERVRLVQLRLVEQGAGRD